LFDDITLEKLPYAALKLVELCEYLIEEVAHLENVVKERNKNQALEANHEIDPKSGLEISTDNLDEEKQETERERKDWMKMKQRRSLQDLSKNMIIQSSKFLSLTCLNQLRETKNNLIQNAIDSYVKEFKNEKTLEYYKDFTTFMKDQNILMKTRKRTEIQARFDSFDVLTQNYILSYL